MMTFNIIIKNNHALVDNVNARYPEYIFSSGPEKSASILVNISKYDSLLCYICDVYLEATSKTTAKDNLLLMNFYALMTVTKEELKVICYSKVLHHFGVIF